jgi:hypothetical protein
MNHQILIWRKFSAYRLLSRLHHSLIVLNESMAFSYYEIGNDPLSTAAWTNVLGKIFALNVSKSR